MLFTSIICAFGTISAASALPRSSRSNYAVKEFHPVPRGWTRVGGAGKSDRVHLSIGLKQQNQGVVEEHLLQVSDPSHSRYGQHLTAAEIEDIIRPSQETQDLVKSWLQEHGIEGVQNSAKDTIHVLIPIEKAEELLQTSYSIFEHEDGSTLARTPEWSLPEHLHEHIDVVQPTNSFFRTKSNYKGGAALHLDTIKYTDSQAIVSYPLLDAAHQGTELADRPVTKASANFGEGFILGRRSWSNQPDLQHHLRHTRLQANPLRYIRLQASGCWQEQDGTYQLPQ